LSLTACRPRLRDLARAALTAPRSTARKLHSNCTPTEVLARGEVLGEVN